MDIFVLFSGGYKGYGLGMMVELFCGILAGAQYSKHIRTWKVTDRIANLVRLFDIFVLFIIDNGININNILQYICKFKTVSILIIKLFSKTDENNLFICSGFYDKVTAIKKSGTPMPSICVFSPVSSGFLD